MSAVPLAYVLPPKLTAARLVAFLGERLRVQAERAAPFARVCYDTFDWRLYRAGLALEQTCAPRQPAEWRLYEIDGRATVASTISADLPGCDHAAPFFPAGLPSGPLAEALLPLCSVRALLPLAHLSGTVTALRVLNKDAKTVARVAIERTRLAPAGQALPTVAWLLPVRGYDGRLAELRDLLAACPGMEPLTTDPLTLATTAAGHPPGDYTSSFKMALAPTDRAGEATRAIQRKLLDTMRRNEAGVIADIDSEFLHDYRVAVRRTRSALSQMKDVLPPQKLDHFREEFGWLGQVTGPTRDLDVYLLQFDDLRQRLPEHLRDRLDPLQAHLVRRQREEQAKLAAALASPRARKLMRQWAAYLDKPAPRRNPPANSALPILVVANQQIWRAFRRVAREAAAVVPASPPEEIHEIRKSAKKLRYLMEFYAALYPPVGFKPLVAELKQLQDVLGEYQDLQVQIESLEGYAAEMQAEGDVPAATLMAIGALTGQLYTRELEVRQELTPYLERFARPTVRRHFAALFNQPPPDAKPSDAETTPEPEAAA